MADNGTVWQAAGVILTSMALSVVLLFIPPIGFFLAPLPLVAGAFVCMARARSHDRAMAGAQTAERAP